MLRDSRTAFHFGVSFTFAPQPVIDPAHQIGFVKALQDRGLTFSNVATPGTAIILDRQSTPLEVRVSQPGPPVGQLVVLAPQPRRTLLEFQEESEEVCAGFSATWPGVLQIVQRDCVLRHTYDVASDHAFRYLWSERLRQEDVALAVFGRPMQGGGLRFVLPAIEEGQPTTEVKIESLLADARKLFVEVQMVWSARAAELDPGSLLQEAEAFASNQVVQFITGEHP